MSRAWPKRFLTILVFDLVAELARAANLIITKTADSEVLHFVRAAIPALRERLGIGASVRLAILPGSKYGMAID